MAATVADALRFFQENIEDLEHKGRNLYIGRCPACNHKEFRFFDVDPVEWRCAKCDLSGWGVAGFVEAVGKNRLPNPKRIVRDEANRKVSVQVLSGTFVPLLEGEEPAPKEIPAKPKTTEINQGGEERTQDWIKESVEYRNHLLSNGHPKRIGPAIWVWLYLNEQAEGREWGVVKYESFQTFIDNMARDLNQTNRNIRNHLNRLKLYDYIRISQDADEIHVINLEGWREG